MKLHTTLVLCCLILFSGMNCHNRTADRLQVARTETTTTWAEIHANSDAIDSALNTAFGELAAIKQTKKTMVRKRTLGIVAPAGPNTFIFQDSTK